MQPDDVTTFINDFTIELLNNNLAIDTNSTLCTDKIDETVVSWVGSTRITPNYHFDNLATMTEYLAIAMKRFFSCMLYDGSLLQLQFSFELTGKKTIKWHRLCYYPCPVFGIDLRELDPQETLTDVIVKNIEEEYQALIDGSLTSYLPLTMPISRNKIRMRMRSPIRFDFDRATARPDHSACHIHFSENDCRIPALGPINADLFLRFIFRNFYSDLWKQYPFLQKKLRGFSESFITEEEAQELHFYFKN